MYAIENAKQDVLKMLKTGFGKQYSPSIDELETPPSSEMGDIAFPCFRVAEGMNKIPSELASEIAAQVAAKGMIRKVEARGPYVNFWIETNILADRVVKEVYTAKEKYGHRPKGKSKRIMVEYANLNTHKEIHIGHLRNMALGQAVSNTLSAAGYDVIPYAYINDLGNHVARCLWAYGTHHADETPPQGQENAFFQDLYVEATTATNEDDDVKEQVSEIQRELESQKGSWVKLWKQTNKWSLDGLKYAFDDFGLDLQKIYLESDILASTKKIVEELIKKGIAVHSEGAWVVRLDKEALGVNLLVKSDGTHLYNAKDLGLAERKEEDYKPDRSIYVVDNRQKLAFAQLFATLKLMGFKKDLFHLSYGEVSLPSGAMSARKGNIVKYWDFRNEMISVATEETLKRHENWDEKRIKVTARAIAFAAMKYSILKVDPEKPVVFDMKEAMSFDGMSGPYLLYTIARCNSILNKSKEKPAETVEGLKLECEHALAHGIAIFPSVVFKASGTYQVSAIAQYLFELGQHFNNFYNEAPVLKEKNESLRRSRIALVSATMQTMKNGLDILGIEWVDEM